MGSANVSNGQIKWNVRNCIHFRISKPYFEILKFYILSIFNREKESTINM